MNKFYGVVVGGHTVVKRKQTVFSGGDWWKNKPCSVYCKKGRGRFVVFPNTGGPPFLLYKGGTGQIQVGMPFLELPLALRFWSKDIPKTM